ncbi:hypothetical protein B0H10DRAFT_1960690 [Mycena sp. CBHHK59/15]|nr:hypothetical protein B0H10DRAFT_1960690 [Mycena sp. CBHHK59/15]
MVAHPTKHGHVTATRRVQQPSLASDLVLGLDWFQFVQHTASEGIVHLSSGPLDIRRRPSLPAFATPGSHETLSYIPAPMLRGGIGGNPSSSSSVSRAMVFGHPPTLFSIKTTHHEHPPIRVTHPALGLHGSTWVYVVSEADRISAPAPAAPTRPSTTTERQSPASLSARDHVLPPPFERPINNASGEPPASRLDAPVTHQLYPVEVVGRAAAVLGFPFPAPNVNTSPEIYADDIQTEIYGNMIRGMVPCPMSSPPTQRATVTQVTNHTVIPNTWTNTMLWAGQREYDGCDMGCCGRWGGGWEAMRGPEPAWG